MLTTVVVVVVYGMLYMQHRAPPRLPAVNQRSRLGPTMMGPSKDGDRCRGRRHQPLPAFVPTKQGIESLFFFLQNFKHLLFPSALFPDSPDWFSKHVNAKN